MTQENINNLFIQNDGIMKTSQLHENGIHNVKIKELVDSGTIEQIKRGYYQLCDENSFSEARIISKLYPNAIICMESALYYYDYTNRTPSKWHLAVDEKTERRKFNINYPVIKPHFVISEKFEIGLSTGIIDGVTVRIYDRERTICDCLTHRNKMDPEVFNDAIKGYLADSTKNLPKLSQYATQLRVEKKVREVIGIWL